MAGSFEKMPSKLPFLKSSWRVFAVAQDKVLVASHRAGQHAGHVQQMQPKLSKRTTTGSLEASQERYLTGTQATGCVSGFQENAPVSCFCSGALTVIRKQKHFVRSNRAGAARGGAVPHDVRVCLGSSHACRDRLKETAHCLEPECCSAFLRTGHNTVPFQSSTTSTTDCACGFAC